ncbi:hypothetical protein ACFW1F_17125 [Streptomyces bungoensis]
MQRPSDSSDQLISAFPAELPVDAEAVVAALSAFRLGPHQPFPVVV